MLPTSFEPGPSASRYAVCARSCRGAAPFVIGEHLATWKAERHYHPRIELAQLPEFLQTDLGAFGKAPWDAAMQEATRQLYADRE